MIFWFGILVTPLIAIPLCWLIKSIAHWQRILVGLLIALFLSIIFYFLGIELVFYDWRGL